ncbi:MAG: hypothetical protein VW687_15160, partial [Curvibacter sp.]
WDPIDDFRSRDEFDRFHSWISLQVSNGSAQEVRVTKPYINATSFTEKWYMHGDSGAIWRLVWPDGPFTGVFEPID